MRKPNTNRSGKDFSKEEELQIWKKAKATDDPNIRLDVCGREIHFDQYKNKDTDSRYEEGSPDYRWEIDHIKPVSKKGGDELSNLQPLFWRTNRSKSDDWPTSPKDYCSSN